MPWHEFCPIHLPHAGRLANSSGGGEYDSLRGLNRRHKNPTYMTPHRFCKAWTYTSRLSKAQGRYGPQAAIDIAGKRGSVERCGCGLASSLGTREIRIKILLHELRSNNSLDASRPFLCSPLIVRGPFLLRIQVIHIICVEFTCRIVVLHFKYCFYFFFSTGPFLCVLVLGREGLT